MRWRLRQLIAPLTSFREVGHFVATSVLLILATMICCGAFAGSDPGVTQAAVASGLFAASTLALTTACDLAVWAIKRVTR